MVASLHTLRDFIQVQQKNKEFILTTMTPQEIDSIASSPSIRTRADISDKGKYQRDLDPSRFSGMKKFWDDNRTQLVDNIVLVVMDIDNPGCVEFPKPNKLKFTTKADKFAQILDGQHRVAGANLSKKYRDEPVPVSILMQSEFAKPDLGLIFTKLNSEAQKIDEFIEMHLCARYELKPWKGVEAENSYKAMMDFYDDSTCVLYKNTRILRNEKKMRYSGKKLAEILLSMWNDKSWGGKMPHKLTDNKTMIEQFKFMLASFFKPGSGLWHSKFTDQKSSLFSSDGFCDVLVRLYPDFYEIAKLHASSGEPTLKEWNVAMNNIVDKSTKKKITDVLKWESYRNYINARMQKSVFSLARKLLQHTISGSGKIEFDFSKAIGTYGTVDEYLQNHIGGFNLEFTENNKVVPTPTGTEFSIQFDRGELSFEKATLNIYRKSGSRWDNIYKNGQYVCGKEHPVHKGMIKTHIKTPFKSKETYKIDIEQETPAKVTHVVSKVITLP